MKFIAIRSLIFLLMFPVTPVAAELSQLKLGSDLVIHPDQLSSLFSAAGEKINGSAVWDWQVLAFAKPYKTEWQQVQARGPFAVKFEPGDMAAQELSFDFTWNDPVLSVGRFAIEDTITRESGGVRVILRLHGACTGMTVSIPRGQWKVKGRLAWTLGPSGFQARWVEFQFAKNESAVPQADFGDCRGPSGLRPALQEAFDAALGDTAWLQELMRDGIMDWVHGSLGDLQLELLKARSAPLKPGLELTWSPEALHGLGGGLVRVSGQVLLSKPAAASKFEQSVERTYADSSLAAVRESGFVLPKDSVQQIVSFLQRTGDLQMRTTSDKVESFTSLMQSRFMQFFVWPDLMNFPPQTVFYFDVSARAVPQVSDGYLLSSGGVRYSLKAPLSVRQWAPAGGQYLPYVDFSSPLTGSLQVAVKGEKLSFQVLPDAMEVTAAFRREFAAHRPVSDWIATSMLGSRVQDYLRSTPLAVDLPPWQLADGLSVGVRDVQQWRQSFRVPLKFKNSK